MTYAPFLVSLARRAIAATYRLLHHLARHFAREDLRRGVVFLEVLFDELLHHVRDVRVHVRRAIGHVEVDLPRALRIPTERSVVLQPIARAVLMHRLRGLIRERIGGLQRSLQVDAHGEALPRVVGLRPPALALVDRSINDKMATSA